MSILHGSCWYVAGIVAKPDRHQVDSKAGMADLAQARGGVLGRLTPVSSTGQALTLSRVGERGLHGKGDWILAFAGMTDWGKVLRGRGNWIPYQIRKDELGRDGWGRNGEGVYDF